MALLGHSLEETSDVDIGMDFFLLNFNKIINVSWASKQA